MKGYLYEKNGIMHCTGCNEPLPFIKHGRYCKTCIPCLGCGMPTHPEDVADGHCEECNANRSRKTR